MSKSHIQVYSNKQYLLAKLYNTMYDIHKRGGIYVGTGHNYWYMSVTCIPDCILYAISCSFGIYISNKWMERYENCGVEFSNDLHWILLSSDAICFIRMYKIKNKIKWSKDMPYTLDGIRGKCMGKGNMHQYFCYKY